MLEITFFAGSWYKKVVAKLTYPVAIIGGCVIAHLPPYVRFMTKHNSIWSNALIMPLTISWGERNTVVTTYFGENEFFSKMNTIFNGTDSDKFLKLLYK